MTYECARKVATIFLTLVALVALPTQGAPTNSAGRVEFAIGNPTASGVDNKARPLKRGAEIFNGDLINTGAGRVQVRFSDGGFMSLQPNTQFKVEDYHFAGKQDGSEKGVFNLVKGGVRTITGLIGKKDNKQYRMHTKVATIGVRGTEYSLQMDGALRGSVASGQLDVCNAGGCAPFGQGQSFAVADAGARPVMTLRKADLPAPDRKEQQARQAEKSKQGAEPVAQAPGDSPQAASAPPANPPPPGSAQIVADGAPLLPPTDVNLAPDGSADPLPVAGTLPPTPAPSDFVQGNATDSSGTSAPIKLTGAHHLGIALVRYTGSAAIGVAPLAMGNVTLDDNGVAQTIASIAVQNAKGGSNAFSAGGEGLELPNGNTLHYALGYPTLQQDLSWLQSNAPVATYSHFAGTSPTGFFGVNLPPSETTIGKFLGGSMSVNFQTSAATLNMNLEIKQQTVAVNSGFLVLSMLTVGHPAAQFTGPCSAGSICVVNGFFAGPMASNANLVYEFRNQNILDSNGVPTVVSARGMAVFQKNP